MKTLIILFALLTPAPDSNSLYKLGEVAFDGFDLVSYHQEGPVVGNPNFEISYRGAKLRFATEDNMNSFKKDPRKYWPAYDGWCAISLVHEVMKKPDFAEFKIQEGRLYFFEIRGFYNGKTEWEQNPLRNEIIARRNYRDLQK